MSNKYRILWHSANYMNLPSTTGSKPNFTTDIQVQKEVGELQWEYFQQVEMKAIFYILQHVNTYQESIWGKGLPTLQ